MSGGELVQDQPSEQARGHAHGEEEAGPAGDPALTIERDAAPGRYQAMLPTFISIMLRCRASQGRSLKATEQPIDTSTAAVKCFLDMLGVFAEFETNLRRERQLEGIAKAKAAGVYKGRPASIDVTKVRQLKAQGMGASEISKTLKIGCASVYRALGERA
jgi:hypothetical protein